MLVTQRRFARMCGVYPSAIQQARERGRVVTVAGTSKIDPDHPTNRAYIVLHRPGGATLPAEAQVKALVARAALLQHQIECSENSYLERDAMREQWEEGARRLQVELAGIPARYVDSLAAELSCDRATAERILSRFAFLVSDELSDLVAEVRGVVERLH
jgi:hypothetical protein